MIKDDYLNKCLNNFIIIYDKTHNEFFYIYALKDNSWIFRAIGIYSFNFDFQEIADVFCNESHFSTEILNKKEWMRKVMPVILDGNK